MTAGLSLLVQVASCAKIGTDIKEIINIYETISQMSICSFDGVSSFIQPGSFFVVLATIPIASNTITLTMLIAVIWECGKTNKVAVWANLFVQIKTNIFTELSTFYSLFHSTKLKL